MPTYEYRCKSCGHELEVQQSFTEDALTTCPSCGAETLRKVFGNIAVTFKGSGFYKTDSRVGASSTSSSEKSESSESSGSSETKTEATKTETTKTDTKKTESKSDTPSVAAAS